MKIKYNIKAVVYGIIIVMMIIGGFVFIPDMFIEDSNPVDYTMVQRDSIPEKILDMMDKYVDEERALAVKLEGKVYVVVTKGKDQEHGIEIDNINIVQEDDDVVMRVDITYKDKEESYPYIVVETNLDDLPNTIELNKSIEE